MVHVDVKNLRQKKQGIELVTQKLDSDVNVMADNEMLQHIIMNLSLNAIQSMPASGSGREKKLSIATGYSETDRGIKTMGFIRVSDTGPGIPAEIQHRIFDSVLYYQAGWDRAGAKYSSKDSRRSGRHSLNGYFFAGHGILTYSCLLQRTAGTMLILTKWRFRQMNIWIVDDEVNLANGLKRAFEKSGYSAKTVKTISELHQLLGAEIPALIFLDQRLPDGNGIDVLPAILKQYPRCKVILMTAFGDSRLVVRAIQEGAYNYLDKPFPLDAAKNMIEKAIESIRFRNQAEFLLSEGPNQLLGTSNEMHKVRDTIMKIAQHQNITVLLQGESGTGQRGSGKNDPSCIELQG